VATVRVCGARAVLSAAPHSTPQRQASDAGEQYRRAEQSPRRERRCARSRTCTRPDLTGQVAAHQRIGAGGVAADVISTGETGGALRGRGAGTALRDGGRGGGGGDCRRGGDSRGARCGRRYGGSRGLGRRERRTAYRHTTHRAPNATYRFRAGTAQFVAARTSPKIRAIDITESPTGTRNNQTTALRPLADCADDIAAHVLCAHHINASRSDERHRDTRPDCGASSHPRLPSSRHRIPPRLDGPESAPSMPQWAASGNCANVYRAQQCVFSVRAS
jgi:hypothetical protein